MNLVAKVMQRTQETASLCLLQSADLNRRLVTGQVGATGYVRQAAAIWRYNLRNFWHPDPEPVHSARELVERQ